MCKILPRLRDIANNEGITIGALERAIGASKGVISRAIANGTDIQSKWLQAIVEKYPQYSAQWLLTGDGEMLFHSDNSEFLAHGAQSEYHISGKKVTEDRYTFETRPRIPFDAAAGGLSVAIGSVSEDQCEHLHVIPTFPHYDFTIIARGDSMEPHYVSGDELACLVIHEKSFIQWGRAHVLDTTQGIIVKRVFDAGDSILCKSDNPNYADFLVPKTDIIHMALVVGYIRIE